MGDPKMAEANPTPCALCPWRLDNQDKRHPHGFYAKANLRRLWAQLRRGERMTCHPTDPRMAEFTGYEGTENSHCTRECTGSLVLVQREFMRLQASIKAHAARGLKLYRQAHPAGLTTDGARCTLARAMFCYPGELPMAKPNLNQPGIGHQPLAPWVPETEGKTL
jgi:hypothetical protein